MNAKFVLALLNSSLINWYYNNQFTNESNLTVNISKEYLSRIPIKGLDVQERIIANAEIMIDKKQDIAYLKNNFLSLLSSNYQLKETTRKLFDWSTLSFKDFLRELDKQKIKLSLTEQSEWMEYFEAEKAKANAIQQVIDRTDKEIDAMVYQLYGLTKEEIAIVESA